MKELTQVSQPRVVTKPFNQVTPSQRLGSFPLF